MKVLHLINSLSMGGAENLLMNLAIQQYSMGYDVTVLQLVKSKNGTLLEQIKRADIQVISLKNAGSVYNPILIFSIIPYLRRYNIIHVHLFPALYWTGLAKILSFSSVPLVFTEHSTFDRRRGNMFLHLMDSFIYKCAYKEVIACSDKALESFKKYYPRMKAISISNGIDIEKYKNAEPYTKWTLCRVKEDSFIITMVARFAYPKRQDVIIKALALLPFNFHVVFVGGESFDPKLLIIKEQVKTLGLSERVHFLYTRSDIPKILKTSDVVVMSSEYEGLSLSSIEGMACGKPFIATNVNGLREIVQGAGVLFECGDEKGLADILLKLSIDKVYYQTVAEQCMARASKYDIHIMVQKYLSEYMVYVR